MKNEKPKDIYYNPKEFRSGWKAIDSPGAWRASQRRKKGSGKWPAADWKVAAAFSLVGAAVTFMGMMMVLAVKPELLQGPYVLAMSLLEQFMLPTPP